ncbi:MAG: serine/threonine protein kinase [Desulfobacteraceae bacterium]|nr:serine/threonine protein kinase [Desulfobacteraceae bacterium]
MSSLANLMFPSAARYRFVSEIGRGGMGIVYLAERHSEGVCDLMVLKTIRSMSSDKVQRLKQEANIATTLRHENIVRTYGMESVPLDRLPQDFREELQVFRPWENGEESNSQQLLTNIRMGLTQALEETAEKLDSWDPGDDKTKRLYLILMEYIEGLDLRNIHREHIRTGLLLPIQFNAFIVSRVCRALGYAHQYIVHRDLSPENILVNDQGVVKLMDFGIAVAADEKVFGLAGKIQYMAPEQALGGVVDQRSDIFALGLVAYQLLTGISWFVPPKGLDFQEQAKHYQRVLEKDIIPPHEICRDIPEEYSQIIMKMLALNPEDRYANIDIAGNEIEKRFLYAKGFGPTNNSLAAYLKMFNEGFAMEDPGEITQLSFLADDANIVRMRRRVHKGLYTEKGVRFLKNRRPGS